MESAEIIEIVSQVIPDLETDEVATLVEIMEQRHAQAGTIMLSQGDSDSHLLLLLNGEFSVFYKCRVNLTTVAMNIGNFSGPGLLGEVNLRTASFSDGDRGLSDRGRLFVSGR